MLTASDSRLKLRAFKLWRKYNTSATQVKVLAASVNHRVALVAIGKWREFVDLMKKQRERETTADRFKWVWYGMVWYGIMLHIFSVFR